MGPSKLSIIKKKKIVLEIQFKGETNIRISSIKDMVQKRVYSFCISNIKESNTEKISQLLKTNMWEFRSGKKLKERLNKTSKATQNLMEYKPV